MTTSWPEEVPWTCTLCSAAIGVVVQVPGASLAPEDVLLPFEQTT
ncbi:hypothetical protein [Streptomyces sp. NBC_01497]|nr:hypothetical protein [Streptomyces sp. NBC_01497]